MEYISQCIDLNKVKTDSFNLIAAGCGTGKSYFACTALKKHYPDIRANEMMIVTSRAMTVYQQSNYQDVRKYVSDIIPYWRGEEEMYRNNGIQIMTYDKLIDILLYQNDKEFETLSSVKLVVFDECHAIFSDEYIHGMTGLQVWIRGCLYQKDKIIFGMTATPDYFLYKSNLLGLKINVMNKDCLIRYKAKRILCTSYWDLPYIINRELIGRTIVMCGSLKQCEWLHANIPESEILTSRLNKNNTARMDAIRDMIVEHGTFPNDIKVLICTSTAREGYSISPESGVKNVVCTIATYLNVIQFSGRVRADLDNIIVGDRTNCDYENADYFQKQRSDFYLFRKGKSNKWADDMKDLTAGKVMVYKAIPDATEFRSVINSMLGKEIYEKSDKQKICESFKICKLSSLPSKRISYMTAIHWIEENMQDEYEVISGVKSVNGSTRSYRKILRRAS